MPRFFKVKACQKIVLCHFQKSYSYNSVILSLFIESQRINLTLSTTFYCNPNAGDYLIEVLTYFFFYRVFVLGYTQINPNKPKINPNKPKKRKNIKRFGFDNQN